MKTLMTFVVISISLVSCSSINRYFGMENDNPLESAIEDVIEYKTGLKIDLTPESINDNNTTIEIWRKDREMDLDSTTTPTALALQMSMWC